MTSGLTSPAIGQDILLQIVEIQQEIATSDLASQAVMDLIAERTCGLAHADSSAIELAEGDEMVYRACSMAAKEHTGARIKIAGSLSGLCLTAGEILNCTDSETDPRVNIDMCRKINVRSMVVVPLRHHKATVGVLKVFSHRPNAFNQHTITTLRLMSELLAAALLQAVVSKENQAAYEAIKAREHDIAQLNRDLESRILVRTEQLEHNQERFRFALQSAKLIAWDWDLKTGKLLRFGVFPELQARFPAEETLDLDTLVARVAPEERDRVRAAMQDCMAGVRDYGEEYRAVDAMGRVRWLRHNGRCIFDEHNLPVRMSGVTADVTDQKLADIEAEEARAETLAAQQRERKALHASEMKSAFLANMSHEIRTPINGVMGMASLLLDTHLSSDQASYARSIYSCADDLLAIINDILDLSKAETGKMVLEQLPFSLPRLVEEVSRVVGVVAGRKRLRLVTRIERALPDTFIGDTIRIRQVLMNLVGNAVKFAEKGDITVEVRGMRTQGEEMTLEFIVTDEGVGIPSDILPTLFTPFTQADASTTRRFGGTGLGLAISKRLVELMGGDIGARSTENVGSTFHFRIPLQVAPVDAFATAEYAVPAQIPSRKLRVLVAEDNAINQVITSKMLERLGHTAHIVNNGVQALTAARNEAFDLVLMDCQMPEMDGFEATSRIRASDDRRVAGIPIIALTANAMTGDRDRCLEVGMSGYLSKPMKAAQLAQEITRVLRQGGAG